MAIAVLPDDRKPLSSHAPCLDDGADLELAVMPTHQPERVPQYDVKAMLDEFRQYRRTGGAAMRERLIQRHLPLVYAIARRYQYGREPLDDLVQEGLIGLMRAVDQFDPERGHCFSTYAYHLILRHISHYLRDYGHLIRQPARKRELQHRVMRAIDRCTQRSGHVPHAADVARELEISKEAVEQALACRKMNVLISLTTPSNTRDEPDTPLMDRTAARRPYEKARRTSVEDRIVLEEAIAGLPPMERRIVRLYFYGSLTLSEIAGQLQITPARSAYLLRCSLDKLKTHLEVDPAPPPPSRRTQRLT